MDVDRKFWNAEQKSLQNKLSRPGHHQEAIQLFLRQHAMVHSTRMSNSGLWSFEDEVLQGLSDAALCRMIGEHSIAWILLHIARVEDVTMNLLVAECSQVFLEGGWEERLKINIRHTGNGMNQQAIASLSAALDLTALKDYRMAVGRRTREIVQALEPGSLKRRVEPARFQRIWDEGAVLAGASAIVDYWSRRTTARLLLMPPTRHNFVHLNEALRLKKMRSAVPL